MLSFAVAFLEYLTKTRLDNRYYSYSVFLDRRKTLKQQEWLTNRIITKQDIENILAHINAAKSEGPLNISCIIICSVCPLWSVYWTEEQRYLIETNVEQLGEAMQLKKPVIHVKASQERLGWSTMCRYIYNWSSFLNCC